MPAAGGARPAPRHYRPRRSRRTASLAASCHPRPGARGLPPAPAGGRLVEPVPGPGERFLAALMREQKDVIVVLEKDGVIRYATPSARELLGSGGVVGARLADLVGDGARAEVHQAVGQMLSGGWQAPDEGEATWRIAGPDGRDVRVEVRCNDLSGDPAVGGVMLNLRDVTAQRAREDALRRMASHDVLTGLPNRALFEDRARRAVAAAGRTGTTAAVLYIDLDDFKPVNDTLGHPVGDELLRAAAARLAGTVRESDTAARLGGDEFAAILENLPGPAAAGVLAGRVVTALGEPFTLSAGKVVVGASVGVATTADSQDPAGILACADRALYAVKAAGKRGWLPFSACMGPIPRQRGRAGRPGGPQPAAPPGASGRLVPGLPLRPTRDVVRLLRALQGPGAPAGA